MMNRLQDFVSSYSVCNHTHDKQIGLPLRVRPILLITCMITDRIGLHLVPLLIINELLLHVNSPVYLLQHLFQRCFVTCLRRYVWNLLPVLKHLKVITNHVFIDQESKFQSRGESNLKLHWFSFTPLCDWSKKHAPLSQPIRCKTTTNHNLVARVCPSFR